MPVREWGAGGGLRERRVEKVDEERERARERDREQGDGVCRWWWWCCWWWKRANERANEQAGRLDDAKGGRGGLDRGIRGRGEGSGRD